mmetsp:Transcript_20415/g.33809  ORF Transcript_20415/g.33809 Transcript_20415/m.33809 type:complete len:342 (-) Transcript_20415:84-1109(-)
MSDSDASEDIGTTSVFKYKKHAFKKRQAVETDSEDDDDYDSCDDDDDDFRKRPKTMPTKSLMDRLNDDDDDDSDDGVRIVSAPTIDPKTRADLLLASDDDDDSSEEEDDVVARFSNRREVLANNKDSFDVIRKARLSRLKLQRAQNYHAEDVHDATAARRDVMDDVDLPSVIATLGTKLSIVIEMKGNRYIREIRKLEPLQKLMDRLRTEFLVKEDDASRLLLKGDEVDLTKTPASYKLVGKEVLAFNVVVKEKPKPKQQLGEQLDLVLRTLKKGKQESEDSLPLRFREPFSKLVESYKKLKKLGVRKQVVLSFEGQALGLNQTPETHDMETEEIIEVTVR